MGPARGYEQLQLGNSVQVPGELLGERAQPRVVALGAADHQPDPVAQQRLQLGQRARGRQLEQLAHRGFDWHYDFEEVFIAQTLGTKYYFFRDNTTDRHTPVGGNPDFGAVRDETSPIATARLGQGDWVYLPARWWHVASCVADSLSISVGVLPAAQCAERIPSGAASRS